MRTCDLCEALEGTDLACPCHCHALVGELRTENDALKARNADMSRALGEAAVTEHALKARVAELEETVQHSATHKALEAMAAENAALRQLLAQAREALKVSRNFIDGHYGAARHHARLTVTAALAAISEPTTEPAPTAAAVFRRDRFMNQVAVKCARCRDSGVVMEYPGEPRNCPDCRREG